MGSPAAEGDEAASEPVGECQGVARVPGCQGARVPGCKGARVPEGRGWGPLPRWPLGRSPRWEDNPRSRCMREKSHEAWIRLEKKMPGGRTLVVLCTPALLPLFVAKELG